MEAGAVERAALRSRLERLEGAMERMPVGRASGETRKRARHSCPGVPRRVRTGVAAARAEAGARATRASSSTSRTMTTTVRDDRYDRREPQRTERDADADDVIEDDDTEVPEHIPDDEVQSTSTVHVSTSPRGVIRDALLADIDAAEFEATLAGLGRARRRSPRTRSRGSPTTRNEDEDDEPPRNPPETSEPRIAGDQTPHHVVSREDEDADPSLHPSPPRTPHGKSRGDTEAPFPPRPIPPRNRRREETVEEMLAAIALEEEQRAARHRAGATGAGAGRRKQEGKQERDKRRTNVGQQTGSRRRVLGAAKGDRRGFLFRRYASVNRRKAFKAQGGAVGGRDRADRGGDGRAHPRVRQGDADDGARGEAGRRLRRLGRSLS